MNDQRNTPEYRFGFMEGMKEARVKERERLRLAVEGLPRLYSEITYDDLISRDAVLSLLPSNQSPKPYPSKSL